MPAQLPETKKKPGLINTPKTPESPTSTSAGYQASTATTAPYTPTMREVGAKETVAGQMTDLTAKNNPYMQRARTNALQFGNKLGLINSSMTAQAGEAAAIDAALPIAQQDAQTHFTQGVRNQEFTNEAGRFNAGEANKTSIFNADAENQVGRDKFNLSADLTRMDRDAGHRMDLEQAQMANQRAIAGQEQANLAWSQYLKGIADINAQDISATAKQEAVDRMWEEYQKGSQIGAALSGATIQDGQVVWGDSSSPVVGSGGSGPGSNTGGNTGGTSGGSQTPAPPAQSLDYFDYKTVDQMPEFMRTQYKERYGDVPPPDIKKIEGVVSYAKDKFKDQLKVGAWTFQAQQQYYEFIDKQLKDLNLDYSRAQINHVITGQPPAQRRKNNPFSANKGGAGVAGEIYTY